MSDMLRVAARELGNPFTGIVGRETHDPARYRRSIRQGHRTASAIEGPSSKTREQPERIRRRGAQHGIVEDAPDGLGTTARRAQSGSERIEIRLVVSGVVRARRAMKPIVDDLRMSPGFAGDGPPRRVGCHARNSVLLQEP